MKTLKNGLKQENIDSNDVKTVLINYSKRDCVKIALYAAEDCFHINPIEESQTCIDLVKKWLNDETSVTVEELRTAAYAAYAISNAAADAVASATFAVFGDAPYAVVNSFDFAVWSFHNGESKRIEYCSYARFFAYEDLSYPYKDFAKTFNLDNTTDLNIFLDFLTDHYPEAITSPREEYFKTKLAKEYLKVIYQ